MGDQARDLGAHCGTLAKLYALYPARPGWRGPFPVCSFPIGDIRFWGCLSGPLAPASLACLSARSLIEARRFPPTSA